METIKPPKSLTDQTYDILLDAICTGELSPGDRLNQDDIANRLNVSRQPVISAISMLRANGFVEDTGRRGVIVTQVEAELFHPILEFRRVVEPFAAELAASRFPSHARDEAAIVLRRGAEAAARSNIVELVQTDIEFHEMIYSWSANPVIDTSMRVNWHHIRRYMGHVLRDLGGTSRIWAEHAAIVEAILSGDAQAARQEMHHHIETAGHRMINAL
ncbi:GntR family transcriptional regulator [Thetidibacter halocola]|uniref:GntR family transcriptional regulator n=1 Tax=Thetidibacter halocola TaxID=2827239 RepID=A0A8J8BBJ5_9RHOB|nr:GntR family transcriptional regulator [Thetidibacter halocola]MBS0126273.1 GntR family transcriptional regulator [Thetidibacter halocola]